MRILILSHGFPPIGNAGAETYAEALAAALAANDDVTVIAREDAPARPELEVRADHRDRFRVYYINNCYRDVRSFADGYRAPRLAEAVLRLVDAVRPEIAHLHHLTNLSTSLVEGLAARSIPMVYTLHDYWLMCHRGQLLDLRFEPCAGPSLQKCATCAGITAAAPPLAHELARVKRRVAGLVPQRVERLARRLLPLAPEHGEQALADRALVMRGVLERVRVFLAPSHTMRDRFVAMGVAADKILYWPYGHVPLPQPPRRILPGPLRVGFLGSLMVSKGPHVLLRAFSALPTGAAVLRLYGSYTPYHGDDSYKDTLAPLLALPGVEHFGQVTRAQIADALADLDVLVVPSLWLENAPLVVAEAFMAGVPVIASDFGGMRELVQHEKNGLLFARGDARALEATLRRVLDDRSVLERLRDGISKVRDIDDDARATRALYARLVSSPPSTRRRIAAVIVNHRDVARTVACAKALRRSRRATELYIVDNGSTQASLEALREQIADACIIPSAQNLGYSGGNNLAIRAALAAGADAVLLVNNDALVDEDCLLTLARALDETGAGIAGPQVLSRDGRVESAGIAWSRQTGRMRLREHGKQQQSGDAFQVIAVSGCVMLVDRAVFSAIGMLDEDFFYTFEDIEFCLRAGAAGFATVCAPRAVVVHEGSATLGARSPLRHYYAARNHLLACERTSSAQRHPSLTRAIIVGLNLANALRQPEPASAVREVLRGVFDFARGRFGERST